MKRLTPSIRNKPEGEVKTGLGVKVTAAIVTKMLEAQLADVDSLHEQDDTAIDLPEKDSPEPPELEDSGDSTAKLRGRESKWAGDQEWDSDLPLVLQLPRRVRPPVRYLIDKNLEVHRLDKSSKSASNLTQLIATAIALHIRQRGVQLTKLGDWRHIPAIGTDNELFELISSAASLGQVESRTYLIESNASSFSSAAMLKSKLKSVGGYLKDFALLLPNGDVITPQAVIYRAQGIMKATRAGAFRSAADGATEIAGEMWESNNWSKFDKANKEREKRKKEVT